MNFIRIFSNLNAWMVMILSSHYVSLNKSMSARFVMLVGLLLVLTGCQQLFHAPDAPLKGQTVTVSMTVPEIPPPAAQPLVQHPEPLPASKQPVRNVLDSRFLPAQDAPPGNPLVGQSTALAPSPIQVKPVRMALVKADTVLAGRTVSEDTVLRGTVLIKGTLVIAPQATLRVEPGTVVRFIAVDGSEELPRLVVQGRIVVSGTSQKAVLFGPAVDNALAGDWGGLVLLNSVKKNSLEHVRIEGAQAGVAAYSSRFSGKGLSVRQSQIGIALYDSEANVQGSTLSRCDIGCRFFDSELDLRDSTMRENRQGVVGQRSSLTAANITVTNNSQEGVVADQCRFRITGSQLAENRSGARFFEGNGQLSLCRFQKNRENGVELLGVRIKINNASFLENGNYGILLENAHGSVTGSVFGDNRIGNMLNRGSELFAVMLNWWGSSDEKLVAAGIHDPARKNNGGTLQFVPFLTSRPVTAP